MMFTADRGRASHAPQGRDDWPYKLDACRVKHDLHPLPLHPSVYSQHHELQTVSRHHLQASSGAVQ